MHNETLASDVRADESGEGLRPVLRDLAWQCSAVVALHRSDMRSGNEPDRQRVVRAAITAHRPANRFLRGG